MTLLSLGQTIYDQSALVHIPSAIEHVEITGAILHDPALDLSSAPPVLSVTSPIPRTATHAFFESDAQRSVALEALVSTVALAALFGITYVAVGCSIPRRRPDTMLAGEAEAIMAGLLSSLIERTRDIDVAITLEPLAQSETNSINDVEQALRVVTEVNSPRCGIVVDTWQALQQGRDPVDEIRRAGPHLMHVQTADPNARQQPVKQNERWHRAILDELSVHDREIPLTIESPLGSLQARGVAVALMRSWVTCNPQSS